MTLQARTAMMVTTLMAIGVLATVTLLVWSERRSLLDQKQYEGMVIARLLGQSAVYAQQVPADVEDEIGQQMAVEATLAAHMVAFAEAAGIPPARINDHLRAITEQSELDEIWITDPHGHAYLHSRPGIDFTFSPDPKKQPQASAFWPLLTGEKRVVVQAARRREVDPEIYKYAAVTGIDRPRIVEVGYRATLLQRLQHRLGLERLVDELVRSGAVVAVRVIGPRLKALASGVAPGHASLSAADSADDAGLWAATRDGATIASLESDLLKVVTPATDSQGRRVAMTVVYLPTTHVRAMMRRQLELAALVAALVLSAGALASLSLARRVTGPVEQLTAASAALESGTFQPEMLAGVARSTDQLGRLARIFQEMAREVQSREVRLKQQVQQLRIEVDEARKAKQVAEITESDYFKQLRSQASDLRRKLAEEG